MARPTTKSELIDAAEARFDGFTGVIDSLDPAEREAAFIFEIEGRKGAHWARDKNVRDVLIHLHEWHNLLLRWVEANLAGGGPDLPPGAVHVEELRADEHGTVAQAPGHEPDGGRGALARES